MAGFDFKKFGASLQSSLQSAGQTVTSAAQGVDVQRRFATLNQTVKEQLGQAEGDDITELPEEYLSLERRVDNLRTTHQSLLRVAKAYESETYDYPTNVAESAQDLAATSAHTLTLFTATVVQGTNLPQPTVTDKPPAQHKTLAHALSRAAANGAVDLGGAGTTDRLGAGLQVYALAQEKVGGARLEQDHAISKQFVQPWSAMLNNQIAAALKSRANVKQARLYLDTCRGRQKSASATRAEAARRDVEAAEESLVTATEEAIERMRAVLESPSSLLALSHLVKAQQTYHAKAAAFLSAIEGQLDDAAVAAEADFRKSRA